MSDVKVNSKAPSIESKLELLSILEKSLDVWSIIPGLQLYEDNDVQELLCAQLCKLDIQRVEFFLPQLCQLVIDRGRQRSTALSNFLVSQCRRSIRTALLCCFIFQAAVDDDLQDPEKALWVRHILKQSYLSGLSSNLNKDLERIFPMYREQCEKNNNNRRPRTPRGGTPTTDRKSNVTESTSYLRVKPGDLPPPSQPDPGKINDEHVAQINDLVKKIVKGEVIDIKLDENLITPPQNMIHERKLGGQALDELELLADSVIQLTKQMDSSAQNSPKIILSSSTTVTNTTETSTSQSSPLKKLPEGSNSLTRILSLYNIVQDPTGSSGLMSKRFAVDETEKKENTSVNPKKEESDKAALMDAVVERRLRKDYFNLQLGFVKGLGLISSLLVTFQLRDKPLKNLALRHALKALNDERDFLKGVYIPIFSPSGEPYKIVRIPYAEAVCLNSREKVPYMLNLEVVSGNVELNHRLRKQQLVAKKIENGNTPVQRHVTPISEFPPDLRSALANKNIIDQFGEFLHKVNSKPLLDLYRQLMDFINSNTQFSSETETLDAASALAQSIKTSGLDEDNISQVMTELDSCRVSPNLFSPIIDELFSVLSTHYAAFLTSVSTPPPRPEVPLNLPALSSLPLSNEVPEFKVKKLVDNYQIIDEWVLIDKDKERQDPNILETAFGPDWETRKERLRRASPGGNHVGWDLISVIVKSGDDLRQEQLAMQLIQTFSEVFKAENLPLWLRPYMVLATSRDSGLIETVHDAISIHGLKQSLSLSTLQPYFVMAYGPTDGIHYKKAQRNFVESLAAYSLVCYLLQIKDRHNGNILIDREGHIMHIDYGFMLSSSPGNLQFEKAPFKLPNEFAELLGKSDSDMFAYFKTLMHAGFVAARKHYKKIVCLVELMLTAGNSSMACFQLGEATIAALKDRFALTLSEEDTLKFVDTLVADSLGNWRTDAYDNFQYFSNGIL